jgi:hypothetical protein
MTAACSSSSVGAWPGRHARHASIALRYGDFQQVAETDGGARRRAIRGLGCDCGLSRGRRGLREDRFVVLELVEAGDDVTQRHWRQ